MTSNYSHENANVVLYISLWIFNNAYENQMVTHLLHWNETNILVIGNVLLRLNAQQIKQTNKQTL